MVEEWKDIKGYKGFYQVSNFGRVKSLSRRVKKYNGYKINKERILKATPHPVGYVKVTLCKKGVTKSFLVHRLVAQTFIPKVKGKTQVNHIDCNKTNNYSSNLEWTDSVGNLNHALVNRLIPVGDEVYNSTLSNSQVLNICELLDSKLISHKEIALQFNVTLSVISDINVGTSWNWLTNRKGSNKGRSNKGPRHYNAKKVVNCRGEIFNTITEAAKYYNILPSGLHSILGLEGRTAGKYPDSIRIKWKYHEEP